MKDMQIGGIELTVHLPGERIHRTTLLASVIVSENQWFNCIFQAGP